MTFEEKLKSARKSALITQEGAANIIGIAKRTYCDWEAAKVTPHRYMQEGALRDLRSTKKKPEKKSPK